MEQNKQGERPRHSREDRARAAELFERGCSYAAAARMLGLPVRAVRQWHKTWRAVGTEGLMSMGGTPRKYDWETKVAAASAVVDEGARKPEAMARYGIASASALDKWCRAYREGGAEALRPKPRGRPRGPAAKTREQELEERVLELEAQVAYLKKARELGARKASRTGRRP